MMAGKGDRERRGIVLYKKVREKIPDKISMEYEKMILKFFLGKKLPGRGNSNFKDTNTAIVLASLRNTK